MKPDDDDRCRQWAIQTISTVMLLEHPGSRTAPDEVYEQKAIVALGIVARFCKEATGADGCLDEYRLMGLVIDWVVKERAKAA